VKGPYRLNATTKKKGKVPGGGILREHPFFEAGEYNGNLRPGKKQNGERQLRGRRKEWWSPMTYRVSRLGCVRNLPRRSKS